MSRWTRLAWLAAGLVGLLAGVAGGLSATARHRHRQLAEDHQAQQARAALRGRGSIRPLDPTVRTLALPGELPRRVLGLYNGLAPEVDAEHNQLHLRAELILNHLGLLLDTSDVNQLLPDDARMERYAAVITWLDGDRVRDPRAYLVWLARQARAGRRVVILGGLGAGQDLKGRRLSETEINQALEPIGLRFQGGFTSVPQRIQVAAKDSDMVEFERRLPTRLEFYERYTLLDRAGRSYLRLRRVDQDWPPSDMVVTTSHGGFVAPGYVFEELRLLRNYVSVWRLNPFRFFAEALGVARTPRPDFTTLNGARIYYSHIDGDGFPSISEVDRKSLCGDLTRERVLEAYDLPVTASFVVADLHPPPLGFGTPERVDAARRIAALPNVELAAHGLAHPMDWREREKATCAVELPGYRPTPEKEIVYSTRWLAEMVAPPGKPVPVMLWTGWCNPAEDMLALCDREGIYNLNGGDPVMDGLFPSSMHLAPPIHQVGRRRQYFTSGPNEYILTEEWQPPFHRWRNVLETFERSGTPRLLPINVYYHWYLVEKGAALQAMTEVMEWVLRQRPAPLFVSEYIDVVRDFEDLRVSRVEAGSDEAWRVRNSGYCRTVRFDVWDRHLDLGRSRGVLGYERQPEQRALYVHLDGGHDHTVMLSEEPERRPYLRRATGYVDELHASQAEVSLITRGIGQKHLTLANLAPRTTYRFEAANEEGQALSGRVRTDDEGTLSWSAAINGGRIEVRFQREDGGD
jgi:polysaccharide biosynthesis protein PelA